MIIDEALDTQPAFTVYLVTVPCIYMVAILFYTLQKARGEENPLQRRKHLFIGFFPLLSLLGGMV